MAEKPGKVADDLNGFNRKNLMKKMIMNLIFIIVFSVTPAFSQNAPTDTQHPNSDTLQRDLALFDSDKLLEVSLRFDLTKYLRKTLNGQSLDAVMTFHLSETDSVNKNIRLTNRGIFRLQTCSFSPMELNFKKADFEYADLNKITKVKLVTHCESGNLYDEYVLREYLVYKLFNVLTDTSFRVRLLRINYIDTQRNRKPIRQYGFLIEPVSLLAARTNSSVVKLKTLSQKNIIPDVMDRLAIFNYMIGDYDWSLPGLHNVAVLNPLKINSSGLGIAIPYDFDLTGVVNAVYAVPSAETGLTSIRDRIFLGICRSKEVFEKDLYKFLDKKEELYEVINKFPYLNQKSKKDIINFLDEFFDQMSRKNSMDNLIGTIRNSCKNM
jgi:hypothetical protein